MVGIAKACILDTFAVSGTPLLLVIIAVTSLLIYYCFEAPLIIRSAGVNAAWIGFLYAIILIFSLTFPQFPEDRNAKIMQNQKLGETCSKLYFPCKPDDVINRIYPKLKGCRFANCVYYVSSILGISWYNSRGSFFT